MLNNFQLNLINPNKKYIAWEIVKVFHPNIDDAQMSKLKVETKYDWITLEIKNVVAIGLEFECKLSSGKKPLELFQKELENNSFRGWRFYLDPKCKDEADDELKLNAEINAILTKYNVRKPTAKQMFDYYHSD